MKVKEVTLKFPDNNTIILAEKAFSLQSIVKCREKLAYLQSFTMARNQISKGNNASKSSHTEIK